MVTSSIPSEAHPDDLAVLARAALKRWDLPADADARLINLSENATFLVTAAGAHRSILRVHRAGYHTPLAVSCELSWMKALQTEAGIETPVPVAAIDGAFVQQVGTPEIAPRQVVMFEFLEGVEPDPDDDLVAPFLQLGGLAARAHLHAIGWQRPDPFARLDWNDETVFGPAPIWGDWRDGLGIAAAETVVLERAETVLRRRLAAYGKGPQRYGLIHADMRLANLLIDGGNTRLIDFDDCGSGWFMYDFAAGISFMEDHHQVPALRAAWLDGYQQIRPLSPADIAEIDSFVLMRRMALLAWTGSHAHTDQARAVAPHFAAGSAALAEAYLGRFAAA